MFGFGNKANEGRPASPGIEDTRQSYDKVEELFDSGKFRTLGHESVLLTLIARTLEVDRRDTRDALAAILGELREMNATQKELLAAVRGGSASSGSFLKRVA